MLEDFSNWQNLCISGIVLIVLEMLTPGMFFLNLALASFVTAGVSLFTANTSILVWVWVITALIGLLVFRPLLVKRNSKEQALTGIGRYIGSKAKVLKEVSKDSGVVSIFDERWNARSTNGEKIKVGETVIIEKNENLILYVRKEN